MNANPKCLYCNTSMGLASFIHQSVYCNTCSKKKEKRMGVAHPEAKDEDDDCAVCILVTIHSFCQCSNEGSLKF